LDANKLMEYKNPPITEAIIELCLDKNIAKKAHEKLAEKLNKHYKNKQHLVHFEVGFKMEPNFKTGNSVTFGQEPKGFRFTSEDEADIVVINKKSILVARLAPYLGWNNLYERAISVWDNLKRSMEERPVISRIGVRYINRIDIPANGEEKLRIEDYVKLYPESPILKKNVLTNYIVQITFPADRDHWMVMITSALVPSPLLGYSSILFDTDVFRTENIPLRDDALWEALLDARDIKNSIFKQCITERAEGLFN